MERALAVAASLPPCALVRLWDAPGGQAVAMIAVLPRKNVVAVLDEVARDEERGVADGLATADAADCTRRSVAAPCAAAWKEERAKADGGDVLWFVGATPDDVAAALSAFVDAGGSVEAEGVDAGVLRRRVPEALASSIPGLWMFEASFTAQLAAARPDVELLGEAMAAASLAAVNVRAEEFLAWSTVLPRDPAASAASISADGAVSAYGRPSDGVIVSGTPGVTPEEAIRDAIEAEDAAAEWSDEAVADAAAALSKAVAARSGQYWLSRLWRTDGDDAPPFTPLSRYVDLLVRSLAGSIYRDAGHDGAPFDARARALGRVWPRDAHTMIGELRLRHLAYCVADVLERGVPGDFLEAGVWRGGATMLMAAMLAEAEGAGGDAARNAEGRRVFAADSFEGLPRPDAEQFPVDEGDTLHEYDALAVSEEQVRENFARHGLAGEVAEDGITGRVEFVKGYFSDTLPVLAAELRRTRDTRAHSGTLALLRLDGDMYESTWVALDELYPLLAPGGYVVIDDSEIEGCATAVHDYRLQHGITAEMVAIDGSGVYWRKS